MISGLASLLSTLKALKEGAEAAIALRDAQALKPKLIELNDLVFKSQCNALAVQEERTTLVARVRELETRLAEFEAWDREKQRYELTDFGCGTFAYAMKPGMENGEPPHRICTRCYEARRKSVLQSIGRFHGQEKVKCSTCGDTVMLGCASDRPTNTILKRGRMF